MKTVILAEKPSQALAYAEAFEKYTKKKGYFEVSGNGFNSAIITFGYGHLVELYNPNDYKNEWGNWKLDTLPILPNEYKFKVSNDKKTQYHIVKKHLDSADEIIVATDSDREGEAIARLIIRLSGNDHKTIKRLWINSLEVDEIQKGFQSLKDGDEFIPSFKSAETRQISDWLVGINLSRLYTVLLQKKGLSETFSIGRVQTPTLYLVYKRQKEIENFVKEPFFELVANFKNPKYHYQGKYNHRFETLEELNKFSDNKGLYNGSSGVVKKVEKKEKYEYAPKLFSLSNLQTEANKRYNFSAKQTLSIAQSLYEKKVTSYPRSDSNYIGTPEFDYLKTHLDDYLHLAKKEIHSPQTKENKRYVNSEKVQEHYAIIPTRTLPDLNKLSDDEKKIYLLILNRTIGIFEKPYVYEETTIITAINDVEFKTTGKRESQEGWKRLFSSNIDNKNDEVLPQVNQGDPVKGVYNYEEGETKPPKYYTEGSLLTAMKNVGRTLENEADKATLKETEGLGTEATRADMIERLKASNYITGGKKLMVTEKGKLLCQIIEGDPISDAKMTATWEQYLKQIQSNQGSQDKFLSSITNFVKHSVETLPEQLNKNTTVNDFAKKIYQEKKIGDCPLCQKMVIDKGKFYGCEGYKDGCKFTLPKKWSNKVIPQKNIKELLEEGITSPISGFKSKKGKAFKARLELNNEDRLSFKFD